MPKNAGGEAIEYSVAEPKPPEGYTPAVASEEGDGEIVFTVTNSYDPEKTSVTVTKKWDDDGDRDGLRPVELPLTLNGLPEDGQGGMRGETADGNDGAAANDPTIPTVTKDGDTWTYTWSGLPMYDGGQEIEYTVSEDEKAAAELGYECSGSPAKDGGTITNTHTPETTTIVVTKIWDDNGNQDGKRPDAVAFIVKGSDGEEYPVQLSANGGQQTAADSLFLSFSFSQVSLRRGEIFLRGHLDIPVISHHKLHLRISKTLHRHGIVRYPFFCFWAGHHDAVSLEAKIVAEGLGGLDGPEPLPRQCLCRKALIVRKFDRIL